MVNSSVSRLTSTDFTPASSNRAAVTEFGQLIQVAPDLLFIMPETAIVTFDIAASAALLEAWAEFNVAVIIATISKHLVIRSLIPILTNNQFCSL